MKVVAGNLFAEINRRNALYESIIAWCHTLPTTDESRDFDAEFLDALEKVVRTECFSVGDLKSVLIGNWWDDTAEPLVVAELDGYCELARIRRKELEVRGEAKKRGIDPRTPLKIIR